MWDRFPAYLDGLDARVLRVPACLGAPSPPDSGLGVCDLKRKAISYVLAG